jgi:hypothetical protein
MEEMTSLTKLVEKVKETDLDELEPMLFENFEIGSPLEDELKMLMQNAYAKGHARRYAGYFGFSFLWPHLGGGLLVDGRSLLRGPDGIQYEYASFQK